jgi:hypothetical protein
LRGDLGDLAGEDSVVVAEHEARFVVYEIPTMEYQALR